MDIYDEHDRYQIFLIYIQSSALLLYLLIRALAHSRNMKAGSLANI